MESNPCRGDLPGSVGRCSELGWPACHATTSRGRAPVPGSCSVRQREVALHDPGGVVHVLELSEATQGRGGQRVGELL